VTTWEDVKQLEAAGREQAVLAQEERKMSDTRPDPVRDRAVELLRCLIRDHLPEAVDEGYLSLTDEAAGRIGQFVDGVTKALVMLEAGQVERAVQELRWLLTDGGDVHDLVERLTHASGAY
jgi:hypothetical protein